MILDAVPADFAEGTPLDIAAWPIVLADRNLPDGRHMVLGDVDGPHHLWLRGARPGQPFAYVTVRDAAIDVRRQAAARFDRRLTGASPQRQHGSARPTPFQRQRHNLLLDILDMLLGATVRPTSHEIARRLIYPGMTIGRGVEWKSSAERRRTQRLIEETIALMNGGYRFLLRGETGGATKVGRAQ